MKNLRVSSDFKNPILPTVLPAVAVDENCHSACTISGIGLLVTPPARG